MRRNKHNAHKVERVMRGCVCHFDSLAEWRYAEWLDRQQHAGALMRWEHHPEALEVVVARKVVFTMRVDFLVWRAPGLRPEYHEVKGMATPEWRLKRKVLEAAMPHVRYVVVDAGRGVCKSGEGEPELFDNRPRRKRRKRG